MRTSADKLTTPEEKVEFRKKLTSLVVPIAVQQLMLSLVSFTDTIMAGFLGQDALSAVSLAGQVQFVFNLFISAVTGGISILAAQYWGKGDKKTVEKVLGIGAKALFLISVPFAAAAFFCPELLMKCFASDEILIEKGAEYLRAVSPSYLLLGISQPYLCVMKNCGSPSKASLISSVSVVLNILLNYLLIFGIGFFPRLEVSGAAVATTISKAVELLWVIAIILKKDSVKLRFKYIIKNDKILSHDYWKYALPVLGDSLGWGVGFTMYSVIMGHLGSDAAAANSIANIVKNLAICVCLGIGSASGILVGKELGSGNKERARKYGSELCRVSLISGIISGCIILCVIPFVPLFSSISQQAQGYLRIMLIVSSYYVVGKAMNTTVIAGIFPSGGDSKFGFKCDVITMWCVTVPIGFFVAFVLKLPVIPVYAIINIDEIIKLPVVYKHYKKYLWLNNLTNSKLENN